MGCPGVVQTPEILELDPEPHGEGGHLPYVQRIDEILSCMNFGLDISNG